MVTAMKCATFRFYEELNDFLPKSQRKCPFSYHFTGKPAVKDAIETLGVPHGEVDLILINSVSVTFDWHIDDGDRISVYPVFESLDISEVTHLRPRPLRIPCFICDVHLGKLAKKLRMLGFDTLYEKDYDDPEIVRISCREHRVILTRDTGLLKHGSVTHGYWLRSTQSVKQLREVIRRFDLAKRIEPFTRCMACNGIVTAVAKSEIEERLEENSKRFFDEFFRCGSCGRIYWRGSHFEHMLIEIESLTREDDRSRT